MVATRPPGSRLGEYRLAWFALYAAPSHAGGIPEPIALALPLVRVESDPRLPNPWEVCDRSAISSDLYRYNSILRERTIGYGFDSEQDAMRYHQANSVRRSLVGS